MWFLSVQLLFFLLLKQLLACPPNRSVELRPSFADPHCCAKENRQTLSLRAPPSANEAMIPKSLTLPLPPPGAMAFEAKWGVNKSNIRCIVVHPEGPKEVTLEVQIAPGHGLLAFSCSIYPGLQLPTAGTLPSRPPLPWYMFIYIWTSRIDWTGPLFFWDCTSTGLVSVWNADHRVKERNPHTLNHNDFQLCLVTWTKMFVYIIDC